MGQQEQELQKIKTLYYFPILNAEDLIRLNDDIISDAIYRLGLSGLKRKSDVIDQLWKNIEESIFKIMIPFEKLKIYQDGLPVCGKEKEIVSALAKSGSQNHRIVLQMIEKGSIIMGTESSDLLAEEYELNRQILETEKGVGNRKSDYKMHLISTALLKKRDQFIADRINSTLDFGDTGLLFLGLIHQIDYKLDTSIKVVCPIALQ